MYLVRKSRAELFGILHTPTLRLSNTLVMSASVLSLERVFAFQFCKCVHTGAGCAVVEQPDCLDLRHSAAGKPEVTDLLKCEPGGTGFF